jgi:4-oxalocrotonate tautomerase
MPTYHIEMLEGRTVEQKRKLAEEITRVSVEVLGGSPDSVDMLITDVKRENWATGGKLWLERSISLREGDAPPCASCSA